MAKTDNYYAVARGKKVGIYRSWPECKNQVDGFQNARYKKFGTESEARKFIAENISVSGGSGSVGPEKSTRSVRQLKRPPATSTFDESGSEAKRSKTILDKKWDEAPVVYTDGACSNNGKANAKAGWGVYWGPGHEDNDCGAVYGDATNNRGELIAVEKALERAIDRNISKVVLRTDSNLLIQSLDVWIKGWRNRGWRTASGEPVKNQDLLTKIDSQRRKIEVKFEHVRGHAGIVGNEMADELARRGAQMYNSE